MTYKDFTLDTIRDKFHITTYQDKFFDEVESVAPTAWLLETLSKNRKMPVKSEKARSELIVSPILVELSLRNEDFLTFFSGERFNVDAKLGLKGECDFIITQNSKSYIIEAPIFTIVEAKKQDLDLGLGQCTAQMIAARMFNKNNNIDITEMYGCVTSGDNWRFLRLKDNVLHIDEEIYNLKELPLLLGVFQKIIDFYKAAVLQNKQDK